jgi:tRNA(Ile)-lysidine synthase
MSSLISFFSNKIETIFLEKNLPKKIAVAVSGGSDSLALTLLLKEFCATKKIKLFAISVDHKMRQNSSKELLELGKILQQQKISHQILEVETQKIPQKNIEANLRQARYNLLYEFCLKNKIGFLFLGHQLDDVAENFLIRLFRGSGLDGLSTISEISQHKKIKLVRPFLDFNKSDLKDFLTAQKIEWFEDESNADEKFLRNKIRNFFSTFEEKNLIQKRVKSACDEISQMRDLFDKIMLKSAKKLLKKVLNEKNQVSFLIDFKRLKKTDEKTALKILALLAMEVSQQNYKPRLKDLKNFYEYLRANQKIKPRNFYGCQILQHDEERLLISSQKQITNFYFRTILGKIF